MSFQPIRKKLTRALDVEGVRYALRDPDQKQGVIVVDLHPAAWNLARARAALAGWKGITPWLDASPRPPFVRTKTVHLTTELGPATAAEEAEEAALLAAIAAAPDDDAPRLVYADRLMARSDPYGELIVMQCKLAAGAHALADAVRDRLHRQWRAYAGPLAPFTTYECFERGFVATVRMSIPELAEHGEAVFAHHPVRKLVVLEKEATDLARLAAIAALARVRALELAVYEAPPLAPLAAARLDRLEFLKLAHAGSTDEDWRRLFAHVRAPQLVRLELAYARSFPAIAPAIAANPTLANLRSYVEHASWLAPEPARHDALAALPLEELSLDFPAPVDGDRLLAPFFAGDARAALRSLTLAHTGITDGLLHAIAASPKAARLERVILHDEAVSLDGLRALVLAAPKLRELQIFSRTWRGEQSRAFEDMLLALPEERVMYASSPGGYDPESAFARRFRRRGP